MGIASKQLEAIFQEIKKRFQNSRYIAINPGESDPPDRYEVTYHISGLHQNKAKEVIEAKQHSIVITIPFGFPHFPPNCKPLSPIFHPDFDQAAICIGDFWTKDSTIPDLILHIGRMISGEIFSTENAFNEAAVSWYKQHKENLPFEAVDFASDFSHIDSTIPEQDSFSELENLEVDSLKTESDFGTDFYFFHRESQEESLDTQPSQEIDVDLLMLMAKQKRYYTLYDRLQAIPSEKQFENYHDLKANAFQELTKAKQLYQQALDLEDQGLPAEALEILNRLVLAVTDYPEIEDAIGRCQNAAKTLGNFPENPSQKTKPAVKQKPQKPTSEAPASKRQLTFFNETPETHFPLVPVVIAGIILAFVSVGVFLYYINSTKFNKAEESFSSCKSLFAEQKFKEAEGKCTDALSIVNAVQFFKSADRSELTKEIGTILNSEKMRQGLAGMVEINGQYVSLSTKQALEAINKAVDEGDNSLSHQSWKDAQKNYQQALDIAARIKSLDESSDGVLKRANSNLDLANTNLLIEEGRRLKITGDIEKAISTLQSAQEKAKSLDQTVSAPLLKTIEPLLSSSRFLLAKKNADASFAAEQWDKAVEQYNIALSMSKNSPDISKAEIKSISEELAKAELYLALQNGKEAFSNAQWDEAISKYESALKLLKENSDVLKQVNSEENRQKISKVMLQASIVRDKQDAARKLKEGKFQLAIEKLESIIDTVNKSNFNRNDEFKQVVKEAQTSISEAKHNQFIANSAAYLVENYKDIFKKNFPSAKMDSLSEPKATFIKKLGERSIFKIECTDSGQGKPLRLVMNYMYDPSTGKWHFYGETE